MAVAVLSGDLDDEVRAAKDKQDTSVEPGNGGEGSDTTQSPSQDCRGGGFAGADVKKDKTAEVTKQPRGAAGAVATPSRSSGVVYLPARLNCEAIL